MHGFGLPAFAAPWPLVLASSSYADGNKNEGPAIQPRQILDDCVQAVQAGDFQRYVGHLSEQRDSRSLHPSVGHSAEAQTILSGCADRDGATDSHF